jgi:hypothetical protein
MAPRGCRKFNFSDLPADLQGLVISKMTAAEAATLATTSREMREVCAAPLEKIKRARAVDAEAIWGISEIINRSFRDPAAQHVTRGRYTISTTEAKRPCPYFFYLTVASEEMSVEFSVWEYDLRFLQQPIFRPTVSQTKLTIGGKKIWGQVPRYKKYDSVRRDVAEIRSCLRQMRVCMI